LIYNHESERLDLLVHTQERDLVFIFLTTPAITHIGETIHKKFLNPTADTNFLYREAFQFIFTVWFIARAFLISAISRMQVTELRALARVWQASVRPNRL